MGTSIMGYIPNIRGWFLLGEGITVVLRHRRRGSGRRRIPKI